MLTINENYFLQKTTRLNQVGLPKEGGSGGINMTFGFSLRRAGGCAYLYIIGRKILVWFYPIQWKTKWLYFENDRQSTIKKEGIYTTKQYCQISKMAILAIWQWRISYSVPDGTAGGGIISISTNILSLRDNTLHIWMFSISYNLITLFSFLIMN